MFMVRCIIKSRVHSTMTRVHTLRGPRTHDTHSNCIYANYIDELLNADLNQSDRQ